MNNIVDIISSYASFDDIFLLKLIDFYNIKPLTSNDYHELKYANNCNNCNLKIQKVKIDDCKYFDESNKIYKNITHISINNRINCAKLFTFFPDVIHIQLYYPIEKNYDKIIIKRKRYKHIDTIIINLYEYFYDINFRELLSMIISIKDLFFHDKIMRNNIVYNIDINLRFFDIINYINIENMYFTNYHTYKCFEKNIGKVKKIYLDHQKQIDHIDNYNNSWLSINLNNDLDELYIGSTSEKTLSILLMSKVKKLNVFDNKKIINIHTKYDIENIIYDKRFFIGIKKL